MAYSPLATERVPAHTNNYTKGRYVDFYTASNKGIKPTQLSKISEITIHHMSGKLTARRCGELFQAPGRGGSSHYGIGYDGQIACYVDENDTAWTNSNWASNCRAVTIETSNDINAYPWSVSDASLKSLIKLVADIAKRNNLGTLVKGKNLTWHKMYGNTDCPGDYLLGKMDYIVSEANKLISGKAPDGSKGEIAGTDKPRFSDELVLYYNGSRALTNQYGFECACDKHGVILENPAYKGGTAIPQGGKVISGHGKAGEWMKKNLKAGYLVWVENGVLKVSKKQHRSVDGVNVGRGSNMLIVYDKGVVNTNPYGYEVQIKDGKAVSAPVYGKGKMQLPKGGFVLSGHLLNKTDSAGWWIYKNIKKGTKVTYENGVITIG